MTKIAFMFPGQGSFAAGMGRDVALAVPEAMAVYDEGSEASGMDLKERVRSGQDLVAPKCSSLRSCHLARSMRHCAVVGSA